MTQYRWASLIDPGQTDTADVELLDDGVRATGSQVTGSYVAHWRLDASVGWVTRSLVVAVDGDGWQRSLDLSRDEAGLWTCTVAGGGSPPQDIAAAGPDLGTDLATALDCDIDRCPMTNLMPIRRLGLQRSRVPGHSLVMAWVELPSLRVIASDQRYASASSDRVRYSNGTRGVDVELEVDADGMVTSYPGLAVLAYREH
ncbi:putative glycolipid-binding domain-containing protein [Cellulomonas sp. URHD0024]|uniref:putative glycolipid-binding domain-containing protein n=1 Tax=Cellulomonas sp. URHD0024 TaxID=1302620 RepID=UPI0004092ADF|nr:putative glycolipid-binding domain-containing protein [Cellulomonas sp. URHD0024]